MLLLRASLIVCAIGAVTFKIWAGQGDVPAPVLVELFTSEGCSSCPPADVFVAELDKQPIKGAKIIPLSLHVDYWNNLGWPDRFSSPQFSRRQSDYSASLDVQTYTPQMIVDGRRAFVGSDRDAASQAIMAAIKSPKGKLAIEISPAGEHQWQVNIRLSDMPSDATAQIGDVMLAIVEDDLHTAVKRGENGGRTLDHTAVTRQLIKVGAYDPAKADMVFQQRITMATDWKSQHLRLVAFVQAVQSRQVLAVGEIHLPIVPN